VPSLGSYAVVGLTAAGTTFGLMPAVIRLAWTRGWVVAPDERRVHTRTTPDVGGLAMFGGLIAALIVAWLLPGFDRVFASSSEPLALLVGATLMFATGFVDDLRESAPVAKFSGMVLAGALMSILGIQLVVLRLPVLDLFQIPFDLAPLLTVVWVVGMCNAVNFIDGLDGLAAGIVAIASGAFFLYSRHLTLEPTALLDSSSIGPLIAVIAFGLCVGFLPHNWHPARVFMGDGGALLLGLLMAASTVVVGGRVEQKFSGSSFFFLAPILVPIVILGVPILDTLLAIVRRSVRRSGVAVADKGHLHHRLMELGHGPRRTVVILWAWTFLLSVWVLYPALNNGQGDASVPAGLAAIGLTIFMLLAQRRAGRA
jgi:UDP-GlcNAc:undecaprenyl-phosphate/decaprenyl-phosphate GlcNAc-1-phosphate transferase